MPSRGPFVTISLLLRYMVQGSLSDSQRKHLKQVGDLFQLAITDVHSLVSITSPTVFILELYGIPLDRVAVLSYGLVGDPLVTLCPTTLIPDTLLSTHARQSSTIVHLEGVSTLGPNMLAIQLDNGTKEPVFVDSVSPAE